MTIFSWLLVVGCSRKRTHRPRNELAKRIWPALNASTVLLRCLGGLGHLSHTRRPPSCANVRSQCVGRVRRREACDFSAKTAFLYGGDARCVRGQSGPGFVDAELSHG